METTIQIFAKSKWHDAAELTAYGDNECRLDYLPEYVFGDVGLPLSCARPVSLGREGQQEDGRPDRRPPTVVDFPTMASAIGELCRAGLVVVIDEFQYFTRVVLKSFNSFLQAEVDKLRGANIKQGGLFVLGSDRASARPTRTHASRWPGSRVMFRVFLPPETTVTFRTGPKKWSSFRQHFPNETAIISRARAL